MEDNRSGWKKLKSLINCLGIFDTITRQELLEEIYGFNHGFRDSPIDKYIGDLEKVGLIGKVSRGKYEILQSIPEDLTSSQLKKDALAGQYVLVNCREDYDEDYEYELKEEYFQ